MEKYIITNLETCEHFIKSEINKDDKNELNNIMISIIRVSDLKELNPDTNEWESIKEIV